MIEIVRRQLAASITTMNSVLNENSIHLAVVEAARLISGSLKAGGKLLVCGNGGSAADSQHLVAEFVSRLTVDRSALRAIALTTDTSILTAIGNDYSYERVFERQVEALGCKHDVLLAISTSGNASNCIKALELARGMQLHTIAYTGNRGGRMAELADVAVVIPSQITMNIQESHLALEHILCMLVERFLFGDNFAETRQQLAE
ncbi:D-sedoheptulose 7-phosphate isomerase [Edaphobacter flagellatus]|uniref:D-sedoheptulose 7-phosphate isomerase n=1 Tax=Edaphobacter flagellatus TaxID=1933044 RepID=UPI0021B39D61|nr:D-sedoheptulose 7-phosphate isomerase [Edaphobacter flagellatus]